VSIGRMPPGGIFEDVPPTFGSQMWLP
jgi:hypothetical protein